MGVAESLQRAAERKIRAQLIRKERQQWTPSFSPPVASPRIGRNQPCPCGSGRKFKKSSGQWLQSRPVRGAAGKRLIQKRSRPDQTNMLTRED